MDCAAFGDGSVATLVSARNSGASYLNRVELQNGCLSLGHANLFIPSTLGGTCMDATSGKVDPLKLAYNMELATEVYINRVNGCPVERPQYNSSKVLILFMNKKGGNISCYF